MEHSQFIVSHGAWPRPGRRDDGWHRSNLLNDDLRGMEDCDPNAWGKGQWIMMQTTARLSSARWEEVVEAVKSLGIFQVVRRHQTGSGVEAYIDGSGVNQPVDWQKEEQLFIRTIVGIILERDPDNLKGVRVGGLFHPPDRSHPHLL